MATISDNVAKVLMTALREVAGVLKTPLVGVLIVLLIAAAIAEVSGLVSIPGFSQLVDLVVRLARAVIPGGGA